ncbi:probable hexosyltransferase MUCI70 [Hordeum vulgare subsp. vulgare]|uniref:TOD1/MUCI70 glycosyltransferase-like domain-containing protein n=1 Tax=Hordeum vulgare subsp. vulgare TaxID=112509 RepID=A0A8I6X5V2_HORVV|nr:probable hexosyltransferase MUCI70 [Hordeum vulgare subsp. vulgare]
MAWVRMRRPPLLQYKLLCLSLLYLLTTLPLALYVSFSDPSRCLPLHRLLLLPARASPPATPLFQYPRGYGAHKHALPTPRALCADPALFSDYNTVLQEINGIGRNLSATPRASPALRYQNGRRDSFAGNLSIEDRRSFFNHTDSSAVEIPCGFFKDFPLAQADRLAMESCRRVVIASAILNDHDKIRQPKGLGSHTVKAACFFMFIDDGTQRVLASHGILRDEHVGTASAVVGAWRVVTLKQQELPYEHPAMNGVVVKHLLHRLFPNAMFSVWVDAKMQLTVDPLLLVHSLLVGKGVDMAVSRHPFNLHAMEEAIATARWRKWRDVDAIRAQMEAYCGNGLQPWSPSKLPYPSDVPDTAIIVRRHGSASDLFSCLLFNELEAFNPRDQLAFAYVRDQMSPKVSINMFEAEVLEHISVEYRHNLKRENGGIGGGGGAKQGIARMASSRDIAGSSCEGYLMKMWGEPAE